MTSAVFAAVQRAAAASTLLVALDFDGTLAPTVDDPEQARGLPESLAAIDRLVSAPSTVVSLISGRSLDGLRRVATVRPEVILVGSHGAESLINGEVSAPALDGVEQDLLERLCSAVEVVAKRYAGARVERKPSGCGLHTRLSSPSDAARANEEALASVQQLDGTELIAERYGKDILEFTVRAADKGSALAWLRELCDASVVVFIGDDVTDEDGFAALTAGDVGIKVGAGETAAEFRISDPSEVARLLTVLASERVTSTA